MTQQMLSVSQEQKGSLAWKASQLPSEWLAAGAEFFSTAINIKGCKRTVHFLRDLPRNASLALFAAVPGASAGMFDIRRVGHVDHILQSSWLLVADPDYEPARYAPRLVCLVSCA